MNWKFWKKIRIIKSKEYIFPCTNCLVKASCNFSKPCNKLEMDNDKIIELFLKYKCCIDCGSKSFMKGPSGGVSMNIKCNECGHEFNMGMPLFIHRIHTQ